MRYLLIDFDEVHKQIRLFSFAHPKENRQKENDGEFENED